MKATTKTRAPNLRALIGASGMTTTDVASKARISTATVYRALRGEGISRLHVWAIATVLGITEAECRAAIERSAA